MPMLLPALAFIPGLFSMGGLAATGGLMAGTTGVATVGLGTTAAYIGGGLAAVGSAVAGGVAGAVSSHPVATGAMVVGGVNEINKANALAQTYNYNAQVMEENSRRATIEAEYNRRQKLRQLRGVVGSQRAAFASMGVAGNTGSALDIAMDTQAQGELEAAWIDYNGKAESNNYMAQASGYRNAASTARKQGYLNAGTTILGTAASAGLGGNFSSMFSKSSPFSIGTRMSSGFNLNPFSSGMIA